MKHSAQKLTRQLLGAGALVSALGGFGFVFFGQGHAVASSTATVAVFATAKVTPSIATMKRADFHFRAEVPGADAEKIPAGDSAHAAAVQLSGVGNQAYALALPRGVFLRPLTSFGPRSRIAVDDFRTDLYGDAGYIRSEGSESVSIGATRAKLDPTLPPGAYCGSVPITVIYP